MAVALVVDGTAVEVDDDGSSLLDVLRDRLGIRTVKDGCSPQGQCGCCTVLVDGAPRVACVTPTRRVAGRSITTLDGLPPERRRQLLDAFVAAGASQCGFCTPGIIVRLAALGPQPSTDQVTTALLAHLCRCTGWQTIVEAALHQTDPDADSTGERDWEAAAQRAALEGGQAQAVGPDVAAGRGGFADDRAPADALVAVPGAGGDWSVAPTLAQARTDAAKVQGRRSGLIPQPPLELPPGEWALVLQTTWVEPAYVEPDASWCVPGGDPASPLANGGAFGGKMSSVAPVVARELADQQGQAVRVVLSREDVVRLGPKRPPIAAGMRTDGTGVLRVVRTPGIAEAIRHSYPGLEV
jgi:xanthine dehydrogenase small subunit